MRSILNHFPSNKIRRAIRAGAQQSNLRAMPDHLRRDIGLPERGPIGSFSRRHLNPCSW